MKKTLKRVFAALFAAVLLIAGVGAQPAQASAAEDGYTAFLMFTDRNWGFGNWDQTLASATTQVTGDGTYTVTLNASEVGGDGTTAASGAMVFCVDIVDAVTGMSATGKTFEVTDLKVTADGNDVAVDMSKIATGDIEEKGTYRIEIYNEYGSTVNDSPIDQNGLSFVDTLSVTFTVKTVDAPASESAAASAVIDNTAFLMFTDRNWAFGNWDATLASATTQVTGAGSYSVTLNATEVGGDGTTAASGAMVFCVDVVGLGATLAASGQEAKLTNISILADGAEVAVDASKIVTGDIEENGNFRIEIYNEYGSTVNDSPIDQNALAFAQTLTVNFDIEIGTMVKENTAFLMFTDRNWAFGNWDATLASATTTVAGDGTYTVTLNASEVGGDGTTAAAGAMVFCVDVVGLGTVVPDLTAITVSDVKILADGAEVAVDASKIVTGDIEENGNFRIEIYNEYGNTAADAPIDQNALAFKDTLSVTFTLGGIVYGAVEAEEEEVVENEIDLNGTFNAYLLLQTPNWTYRDGWNSANGIGSDNWGQFIKNNDTGETYGVVTDTVIAGNGTYTVTITDLGSIIADDFAAAGQDYFNILGVTTDIPYNQAITITNLVTKMDGKEIDKQDVAYQNPDDTDYFNLTVQNIWNSDRSSIAYYSAPTSKIEITFTVSGFAYDKEEDLSQDVTVDEPTEDVATPDDDTQTSAPAEEDGAPNMVVIIVVVVVVVVVAAVAGVLVAKKKKTK